MSYQKHPSALLKTFYSEKYTYTHPQISSEYFNFTTNKTLHNPVNVPGRKQWWTIATLSHLAGKGLELDIDNHLHWHKFSEILWQLVLLLQWRAGLIPKLGLQFIKTTKGRVGSQILDRKELFAKLTVEHKKFSPHSVLPNTIIAKYNYFLETTAGLPTVSHSIALSRLGHHSPGGWTTNWPLRLRRWRVVNGTWSTQRPMRSVPQGHLLNPFFPASLSVSWRRQQSTGSWGLQMRSTRARKRMRANAKSCSREGRTWSSDAGWGLPGWGAALLEEAWEPWQTASWAWF